MEWNKFFNDLAISTEKPINEGFIFLAIWIDLYKSTNNKELKLEIEEFFIIQLKNMKNNA